MCVQPRCSFSHPTSRHCDIRHCERSQLFQHLQRTLSFPCLHPHTLVCIRKHLQCSKLKLVMAGSQSNFVVALSTCLRDDDHHVMTGKPTSKKIRAIVTAGDRVFTACGNNVIMWNRGKQVRANKAKCCGSTLKCSSVEQEKELSGHVGKVRLLHILGDHLLSLGGDSTIKEIRNLSVKCSLF